MSASKTRKKMTGRQTMTIGLNVLGALIIIIAFNFVWTPWPWTLTTPEHFFAGYAFSIIAPIPLLFLLLKLLRWIVEERVVKVPVDKYVFVEGQMIRVTEEEKKAETTGTAWLSVVVGMVERTVITVLVAWSIPGTAAFIGAWVATKMAGGWSSWSSGTVYARSMLFVGLLGSLLSVLFAVIGGIIVRY